MSQSIDTATTTILCATDRQARQARLEYNAEQRQAGSTAWDMPNIQSVRAYATDGWLSTFPAEQLLHPAQELQLALTVVRSSEETKDILSAVSLARQVRHAMTLCIRYGIDPTVLGDVPTPEQCLFAEWSRQITERLETRGWVMQESVYAEMTKSILAGAVPLPSTVILRGFDSMSPAVSGLVDALEAQGATIERATVQSRDSSSPVLHRTADIASECSSCAARVLDELTKHGDRRSVGILVPSIDDYRGPLNEALGNVLTPDNEAGCGQWDTSAWRWARGAGLSTQSVIAAAQDIFSIRPADNAMEVISPVLLGLSIWGADGREQAAATEYRLRKWGGVSYRVKDVTAAAEKSDAPDVAARFKALAVDLDENSTSALPSTWANRFRRRLKVMGWLSDGELGTVSYQAREALYECLDTFASMDAQTEAMSVEMARWWVREIVSTRGFEPKAVHTQPVVVMDYEDAYGLQFDCIQVLGATADVLPRPVERNPFIAGERLVDAGYEQACNDGVLSRSQALIENVFSSAAVVDISFPSYDAVGASESPTALLGPWPNETGEQGRAGYLDSLYSAPPSLEYRDSDPVPVLHEVGKETPVGGVAILKNYAESPFFAFARGRLAIDDMPKTKMGISASVAGTLVHTALKLVWDQLVDSEALRSASEASLKALVRDAVESAAEDGGCLRAVIFGHRLAAMEKRRVVALVLRWLGYETSRIDPFKVTHREVRATAEIDPLELNLQIDRVDEVEVGETTKRLIIDYKTGSNVSANGWDVESLTDPQLPIYAVSSELRGDDALEVDGIALAHVDISPRFIIASGWTGNLCRDSGREKAMDFDAARAAWEQILKSRAAAFGQGDAGLAIEDIAPRSFNHRLLMLADRDLRSAS